MQSNVKKLNRINLNIERGIFNALADLIKLDDGIVWDSGGACFCLSCGYRISCDSADGMVYDPFGQELFVTNDHIIKLNEISKSKKSIAASGFFGRLLRQRSK